MKRKLGPKRAEGSKDGLTRTQAEARLREVIAQVEAVPAVKVRVTFADAAARMLDSKATRVKPTTLKTYHSLLNTHVLPAIGDRPLAKVTSGEVDAPTASMARMGHR